MARKAALDIGSLTALGPERLARLVLDEALRDSAFRNIVKTALAARQGPEAVAKLIDRRLVALEKAKCYIDAQKERAFRADLAATLETITGELGWRLACHEHGAPSAFHRHACSRRIRWIIEGVTTSELMIPAAPTPAPRR